MVENNFVPLFKYKNVSIMAIIEEIKLTIKTK